MARKRSPPTQEEFNVAMNELDSQLNTATDMPSRANGPSAPERITRMKVNFQGVSTGFAPREAGEYPGTLVKHTINAASKTSGQPTVNLEWAEDENPQRKMFKTYSLQPKALFAVKRDLIRMGADVEQMNSPEADLDEIVESLYGTSSVLVYGDPRPDEKDPNKLYDNFLEVRDPSKV